ncbi:MAG: low molecular weight phosphotyrosine protein phosphatase [Thiohalocapsa sp.]|jgi:protein-tyrosine phosphatase|uniref:low molecular weight protein-tyrosine-phosphatase n=1 Tax=Thiohalocapsa sp. TaxID=2497641 RepID=UPI0025CD85C8|nr:low molecular weight protein-tyrosine-phosphatase [Thiohalocapsa sp.]MCG6940073.1 low molecular weight phosphotyrosine protein phosphatase [Thiohalocapsa sp.]
MTERATVKVLFVCMGNICRSPTAQGVFRKLVQEAGLAEVIEIDSAGTHAYHVGEPPDPRAQETARRRGIDLSDLRARRVTAADLEHYHYVLVMDQDNYHALSDLCPPGRGLERRVTLLMDHAPQARMREVPDPYYGASGGFEAVFDMVEEAAAGLLEDIRQRHL